MVSSRRRSRAPVLLAVVLTALTAPTFVSAPASAAPAARVSGAGRPFAAVQPIAAVRPVASVRHFAAVPFAAVRPFAAFPPFAAEPKDDARAARRAADRAEAILEDATVVARNAARRLEAATAALPAAQKKVAASRGVVIAARVQASTARRRADAARTSYQRTVDRYAEAQERVEQARDRVDQIASASYMGADIAALNVIAGARGPQDAMDRLNLVDQVMHKQQDSVDQMTAARREVRVEQDRAGLAKRTTEDTEREAVARYQAARDAQAAAEQARAAVLELAASRRQALLVARSQRAAVLAKYKAARAQEDRIVAALRTWDTRHGGGGGGFGVGRYGGGRLLMPVIGWKSSDFGSRYDPYYHVWQLHAGMDIAAGGGTPIHAAADGRVIQAGYNGGYGNYTCLSHGRLQGEGFTTCYGHQSRIGVRVGERVRRGEVIGRVGTTGASTGYHLHFETRINGAPRDPRNFLPGCLC